MRRELEEFRSLCAASSLPPGDAKSLTKDQALRVQARRFEDLVRSADAVASSLGERLRAEIDRGGALRSSGA